MLLCQACYGVKSASGVIHNMHLEDARADAPIQPHVRQTPVEGDHVAGHQIELVDLK